MSDGTFQGGLNTTLWIDADSIGVSSPGRPVTARIESVGVSLWNTVRTAAAILTWMRSAGSSCGSQRQRSILPMICSIRCPTGTLRAARVCLFRTRRRLEAIALLGADDRLRQAGVEDGGRRRRRRSDPRPPAARAAPRRAGSVTPSLSSGPAASGCQPPRCGDAAIDGQPAPQRVVAGIGRRQAVEPGAQAVLLHRLGEVRARIVGRRAQAPVVQEGVRAKPARVHGLGIAQRSADQQSLASAARVGVARLQAVETVRGEGVVLEAVGLGLGQGPLQKRDLVGPQGNLRQGGGRRRRLPLHGRCASERGRRGLAHADRGRGDHGKAQSQTDGRRRRLSPHSLDPCVHVIPPGPGGPIGAPEAIPAC